jgi:hypothetical protein
LILAQRKQTRADFQALWKIKAKERFRYPANVRERYDAPIVLQEKMLGPALRSWIEQWNYFTGDIVD